MRQHSQHSSAGRESPTARTVSSAGHSSNSVALSSQRSCTVMDHSAHGTCRVVNCITSFSRILLRALSARHYRWLRSERARRACLPRPPLLSPTSNTVLPLSRFAPLYLGESLHARLLNARRVLRKHVRGTNLGANRVWVRSNNDTLYLALFVGLSRLGLSMGGHQRRSTSISLRAKTSGSDKPKCMRAAFAAHVRRRQVLALSGRARYKHGARLRISTRISSRIPK